MGIPLSALKVLKDVLPAKRVLMLGYQDLLVGIDEVKKLFPLRDWSDPVFNPESQKWHNLPFIPVDAMWFFERMGSQLTIVDKIKHRGNEIDVDLNYPADLGAHDLVIDAGTIEHCMNIGQALMNCANAVAVGGHIFHETPLNMMNHGFYNVNPTLYYDFYVRNNWAIKQLFAANSQGFIQIPRTQRFQLPPEAGEMSIHVLVERLVADKPVWQTQTKYQPKQKMAA